MATRLTIAFDGTTNGLSEHRLSIAAFGPALAELLKVLRRIATNIVEVAGEEKTVGRLKAQAAAIDLELRQIHPGSADPEFVVTQVASGQIPLFQDFTGRAIVRLLEDIQGESEGKPRNAGARAYLAKLPEGITSQRYVAYEGESEIFRVEFGSLSLPEAPSDLPSLRRLICSVVGVGFEPGTPYVEFLQPNTKPTVKFIAEATASQVEKALAFRSEAAVEALCVVKNGKHRLLSLRPLNQRQVAESPDARVVRINREWPETLAGLAK